MAVHKLYTLENEIGTRTKYKQSTSDITSTSVGICVALSALWCHNMLNGSGALGSRPDYRRASLLQGIYERIEKDDGSDLRPILEALDMDTWSRGKKPGSEAIHNVAINPGLYMLRYPGHAMAAKSANDGWFFLDPEEGLFLCTSGTSFEKQVWSLYKNRKNEIWTYQSIVQGTGRDKNLTRPTSDLR